MWGRLKDVASFLVEEGELDEHGEFRSIKQDDNELTIPEVQKLRLRVQTYQLKLREVRDRYSEADEQHQVVVRQFQKLLKEKQDELQQVKQTSGAAVEEAQTAVDSPPGADDAKLRARLTSIQGELSRERTARANDLDRLRLLRTEFDTLHRRSSEQSRTLASLRTRGVQHVTQMRRRVRSIDTLLGTHGPAVAAPSAAPSSAAPESSGDGGGDGDGGEWLRDTLQACAPARLRDQSVREAAVSALQEGAHAVREMSECKAQLLRSYARFWSKEAEHPPDTLAEDDMPSLVSHLHRLLSASAEQQEVAMRAAEATAKATRVLEEELQRSKAERDRDAKAADKDSHKLRRQLVLLRSEIDEAQNKAKGLRGTCREHEERQDLLAHELSVAKTANDHSLEILRALRAQVEEKDAAIAALEQANSEARQEHNKQRDEMAALRARLTDQSEDEQQRLDMQKQLVGHKMQRDDDRCQLKELHSKLESALRDNQSLQQQTQSLEGRVSALTADLGLAQTDHVRSQEALRNLDTVLDQFKAERQIEHARLTADNEGLRRQLRALQEAAKATPEEAPAESDTGALERDLAAARAQLEACRSQMHTMKLALRDSMQKLSVMTETDTIDKRLVAKLLMVHSDPSNSKAKMADALQLLVRMLDCSAEERNAICSGGAASTTSRVVAFLSSWASTPSSPKPEDEASPQLTDLWVEFLLKETQGPSASSET